MENLRALRRSRSLTFLDLAALTGIPARHLAEIEHGLRRLGPFERDALALVLGIEPHAFTGAHRRPTAPAQATALAWAAPADQRAAQALLAAALAATVAAGSFAAASEPLAAPRLPRWSLAAPAAPATSAPAIVSAPVAPRAAPAAPAPEDARVIEAVPLAAVAAAPATPRRNLAGLSSLAHRLREGESIAPALVVGPTPGEEVAPAPLPVIETAPAFTLTADGPMGCPVKPAAGRVVMTQGYGVGTHAPAAIWGAVDLAVDGNGDGYAEGDASWYAPIVATHDGHVTVTLDSYPAGNHVWVNDPGGVWRTGYAHLAIVTVVSGQFVRAGEQIGLLGSTGMSTGPHLDYQVWRSGVNIDPTWLVGCS